MPMNDISFVMLHTSISLYDMIACILMDCDMGLLLLVATYVISEQSPRAPSQGQHFGLLPRRNSWNE